MVKMVTSADLGRQVTEKVLIIWSSASSTEGRSPMWGPRLKVWLVRKMAAAKGFWMCKNQRLIQNPRYESWMFLTALDRAAFLSNCTAALVLNTYHPQLLCMPSYHTIPGEKICMDSGLSPKQCLLML